MREFRELAPGAWYEVQTSVNDREPLFLSKRNMNLFMQVLYEAREIYGFLLRGLRFDGAWVSFYIKPGDGLQLPEIMQWMKQTFSVRFNVREGRTGHIWGDRYESWILPGEPPEDAEEYVFLPVVCGAKPGCGEWVRKRRGTRRAALGRDRGRLNRIHGPIQHAVLPFHTTNRPG
jgi:hypothetical protein